MASMQVSVKVSRWFRYWVYVYIVWLIAIQEGADEALIGRMIERFIIVKPGEVNGDRATILDSRLNLGW